MQYKSLSSLLHEEFIDCKINKTSVTESGLTVSIERLKDEFVYFFHTDSSEAREILNMPDDDQKSCDYFVLYTKVKNNPNEVGDHRVC